MMQSDKNHTIRYRYLLDDLRADNMYTSLLTSDVFKAYLVDRYLSHKSILSKYDNSGEANKHCNVKFKLVQQLSKKVKTDQWAYVKNDRQPIIDNSGTSPDDYNLDFLADAEGCLWSVGSSGIYIYHRNERQRIDAPVENYLSLHSPYRPTIHYSDGNICTIRQNPNIKTAQRKIQPEGTLTSCFQSYGGYITATHIVDGQNMLYTQGHSYPIEDDIIVADSNYCTKYIYNKKTKYVYRLNGSDHVFICRSNATKFAFHADLPYFIGITRDPIEHEQRDAAKCHIHDNIATVYCIYAVVEIIFPKTLVNISNPDGVYYVMDIDGDVYMQLS